MKINLSKVCGVVLGLTVVLPGVACGAAQVQVNFDSGTQAMFDQLGALLRPGSAADGDGAIIQLGYYDAATVGNHFAGVWRPLTGVGSLNSGGDTGSGLSFTTTSIGDIGGGAPDGSGIFAFSLVFDDTVAGTFNDLPGAITTPLALRFYNGATSGGSTHFNVVSNDAWLWKLPATPSPLPPTINVSLSDPGLEWQSIVAGQSAATAFQTSLPAVPEPRSALLVICGSMALAGSRCRRASIMH